MGMYTSPSHSFSHPRASCLGDDDEDGPIPQTIMTTIMSAPQAAPGKAASAPRIKQEPKVKKETKVKQEPNAEGKRSKRMFLKAI